MVFFGLNTSTVSRGGLFFVHVLEVGDDCFPSSQRGYSVLTAICSMGGDSLLYLLLGLYLDRTFPKSRSVAHHPCFCCLPSFWPCCTASRRGGGGAGGRGEGKGARRSRQLDAVVTVGASKADGLGQAHHTASCCCAVQGRRKPIARAHSTDRRGRRFPIERCDAATVV